MKLSIQESYTRMIFNNFLNFFATTCGIQILQGCRYSLPAADFPLFNSVLDTQLPLHAVQASIQAFQKVYQSKKQFCWWITDFVNPRNLSAALLEAGFQAASSFKGMYYDLSKPLALPSLKHITVHKVKDAEQLDAWINPLQVGFSLDFGSANFCVNSLKGLFHDPRFSHFYVEKAGNTVGIGSLFIEKSVSGFYNLAVLPEYRGQEVATALKAYRLQQSQALGAKVAILQSSSMGQALDQRLGFKPVCEFVPYLSPER